MSFGPLSGAPLSGLENPPDAGLLATVTCTASLGASLTTAIVFAGALSAVAQAAISVTIFTSGLIYYDGWDDYTSLTDYWSGHPASIEVVSAAARTGSYGLRLKNNVQHSPQITRTFSGSTTCIVGFAYRLPTAMVGSQNRLVAFRDGNTTQTDVRINTNGTLSVTRNGTTLATGSSTLTTGVWYYLEFKTVCHGSSGSYELRINTATEVSASGVNTQATGSAWIDTLAILPVGEYQVEQQFDDLYWMDPTVVGSPGFLGAVRIGLLTPTTDYAVAFTKSGGTTNVENVDDLAPDGDTTYTKATTIGLSDVFSTSGLGNDGRVYGVAVVMTHQRSSPGALNVAPMLQLGATLDGSTQGTNSEYRSTFAHFDESPVGGWNDTDIDLVKIGYKSV